MHKPIAMLLTGALILSSCGTIRDSRINPRNWFGTSAEVSAPEEGFNPLIPEAEDKVSLVKRPEAKDNSTLVQSVTTLRIEQTPTGAIVYAEGLPTRQGAFGVGLVPNGDISEDGILELALRVTYPQSATRRGNEFSRTVRAAYSVSNQDLRNVRVIRVIGQDNARETRRR